jgi:hypothetical protein
MKGSFKTQHCDATEQAAFVLVGKQHVIQQLDPELQTVLFQLGRITPSLGYTLLYLRQGRALETVQLVQRPLGLVVGAPQVAKYAHYLFAVPLDCWATLPRVKRLFVGRRARLASFNQLQGVSSHHLKPTRAKGLANQSPHGLAGEAQPVVSIRIGWLARCE